VRPGNADIRWVEPSTCDACGSDLALSGARYCSECGAPITDDERSAAPTSSFRVTDGQWRYITWTAVAVAIVAAATIAAVAFGTLTGGDPADTAVAPPTIEMSPSSTVALKAIETVDVPVTEPIMIESPRIGPSTRYHRDGAVVVLRLTMEECERSDGMLRAAGSIRNGSALGQTFTYALTVDLSRAGLGTRLARLESVAEGVGPGEVVGWSVETPSTKVVTVRCGVTAVTVTPLTTP